MSLQEQFKTNGFVVLKNKLEKQTCELIQTQFKMTEMCAYHQKGVDTNDLNFFRDDMVPQSFPSYGSSWSDSLLLMLQSDFENITQLSLLPCYSYARIMHRGADMFKHKDRPSCQYSATICISEDSKSPYPIFMEDYSGNTHEVHLAPGDMILYHGTELNHWREVYNGDEQMQVFIHYVDAKGPYAHHIYDGRAMLGLPAASRSA